MIRRYVNLSCLIRIKIFQLQFFFKKIRSGAFETGHFGSNSLKLSVTVCPFYEMLLRSKKVSHGDFGKGPEDDNFILNDE